jgi:hypothetical protein
MKAIIFIRTGTPRIGFVELGHVGWGFEVKPGIFNIGAVENAKGGAINVPPHEKDQWSLNTQNPYRPFGVGPTNSSNGKRFPGYDMFKIIEVNSPNPNAAIQMVQQIAQEPYQVIGNNCMDAVYRILKAYGVSLSKPSDDIYPMNWFKNINATPYVLQDSVAKIDFSLYEHPNFEGDSVRLISNNSEQGYPTVNYAGREIEDRVSSINLRSGTIRIFEHPNYQGKSQDFTGPCIINELADYGMHDRISSVYAWPAH